MPHEEFSKGAMIDGRYEIRELLGQGGMGAVYRAVDMKLGQTVAVKMLLTSGGDSKSKDDRRKRFLREVLAINEVHHRNVVHIQEFGFHRDVPYMVMEFLKGKDLGKVLHESKEPPAIDYVVDLLLVVCAAIRACHTAGVIHRDLKPGNIMVVETDSGNGWDVKVVDFSISKAGVAGDLTQEGKIIGTPRFLSPEQISGKVSPASDQYAIGVLLYVCLTKRHPYEDFSGLPLIRAIEKGEFRRPREHRPEIPEALEEIVLKAMRVTPAERHSSVFELGQRLWDFASPLGRDNWKKFYFHTPGVAQEKVIDGKLSSTGIPLIRQMAEGSMKLGASTVSAHYQSTTAFQDAVAPKTLDDPEAKSVADAAAVDAKTGTPREWHWQTNSTKGERPGALKGDGARPTGLTPRRLGIGAGILVGALAVGIVGATQMRRRAQEHGSAAPPLPPAAASVAPAAEARVAVIPSAPSPTVPSEAFPAGPAAVEKKIEASGSTKVAGVEDDSQRKRTHRDHGQRRKRAARKAGEWETDANGIPIPP